MPTSRSLGTLSQRYVYAVKVKRHKPWSVVVDPRNVVHALSISLVNFIGNGTDFA